MIGTNTVLPWIVLVLVLFYLAGTSIARRNIEAYYAQCAEEYRQQMMEPEDIHAAVREIQACVDAKKGLLERLMITRTEVLIR